MYGFCRTELKNYLSRYLYRGLVMYVFKNSTRLMYFFQLYTNIVEYSNNVLLRLAVLDVENTLR